MGEKRVGRSALIRIHVLAEGVTERSFIERVLCPYLLEKTNQSVYVDSRCVLTSKDLRNGRVYRGGLTSYVKVKNDLKRWLREDASGNVRFSTMFDLYALPNDFPGFADASRMSDPYERVEFLENAFMNDIGDTRFLPYIQLHEFEALIFVDPLKLKELYLNNDAAVENLVEIAGTFDSPEKIDNGVETAPSKRILKEIPEYDKVFAGVETVQSIGVDKLMASCKHFSEWVNKLSLI